MAVDFSQFNFFKRLGARARIAFVIAAVLGFIAIIYLVSWYIQGGDDTTGASRVASVPSGVRTVQGGQLTPEYSRKLQESNVQVAQTAVATGGSAIGTMLNTNQPQNVNGAGQCNIICSDQSANVRINLEDWVRQGKIADEISSELQDRANKNIPVSDFASYLDQLVKEGKLTPEQARELLEQYKRQHANQLLQESAKMMDGMIKAGQMPIDTANRLLQAQKDNMSPSDYALFLQELVKEGKISPALAQQLLAQYTQQRAREIINQSIASLRQLTRNGQLLPDIEKELIDLENRMVPIDTYSAALQKHITAGKLVPAIAGKILDEYKFQKASIGSTGTINRLLQKAEADAFAELDDLLKSKKITPQVAELIRAMIPKNPTLAVFTAFIEDLVAKNQLTPEIGKLKIADYRLVKGLREVSQQLTDLQANNASLDRYSSALKAAIQAGLMIPDDATQIMQEYQASTQPIAVASENPSGNADLQRLQQQLQESNTAQPTAVASEFDAVEVQSTEQAQTNNQSQIQDLMGLMSNQAQQFITAWQPVEMAHKEGIPEKIVTTEEGITLTAENGRGGAGFGRGRERPSDLPVMIKGGTILFAVLDTEANSDYPDSPVMATIVEGQFKGAKLLGKLVTTKGVAGQQDRIGLNFTMMNMDMWPKSKSITAYGIDPDTARTVMASNVDYHYLKRYGAIMATSFIQGYANAILSEGNSTTGIFGTSTSHPKLSPANKLAVAVGQVGQTLGSLTQNYINLPPTVKVDSGVGLGILFMSDITG